MARRLDSLATPRGHLPARVYWTRRLIVLGMPLLLLVVVVAMLSGGGGSPGPTARLAGSPERTPATHPSSTPRPSGPVAITTSASPGKAPHRAATSSPTAVPLAAPDGACAADEITVTPSAQHARAGGDVTIAVQLRTARPACTFAVSAKTLAVKITSGSDGIWSSQLCRGSVPRETVVVRSAQPAVVPVTWNGRRTTDGTCGVTNAWARPGYYHALAAVIGSEPTDAQFQLSLPPRPVVTKTAHPKPQKTASKSTAKASPSPAPSQRSGGPSGTGSACGGDNAAGTC